MERTNAWLTYSEGELGELERISSLYKACLDEGKTERECVKGRCPNCRGTRIP